MNTQNTLIPWTMADREQWFKEQSIKRSYQDEVVSKINDLSKDFDVIQYGSLKVSTNSYPLFMIKSKNNSPQKKTVLITGGVHGYETSGVQGALAFMKHEVVEYARDFNFICAPCISPWGYETINRWNSKAMDPNRSFVVESPADECRMFLQAISPELDQVFVHFDLHETTDTDNTVFRIALAKRDGKEEEAYSEIPDGFYTVGNSENPCPDFQKAIIDSVRKITHIAAPDSDGKLIGETPEQEGVVLYPAKKLALCMGVSNARYTTTTEVYPDSPRVDATICIEAQIAAIKGGLAFIQNIT